MVDKRVGMMGLGVMGSGVPAQHSITPIEILRVFHV
jgi:hypothetical protein